MHGFKSRVRFWCFFKSRGCIKSAGIVTLSSANMTLGVAQGLILHLFNFFNHQMESTELLLSFMQTIHNCPCWLNNMSLLVFASC